MIIFLNLLLAHFIADFLLQNKHLVETKKYSALPILVHSLIVGVVSFIFVRIFTISIFIFISHLIIDFVKNRTTNYFAKRVTHNHFYKTEILLFIADQLLHIVVIMFLFSIFRDRILYTSYLHIPPEFSLIGLAYIIAVCFSAVLIRLLTKPYEIEVESNNDGGLIGGGKVIGKLERFIILTMILTDNPIGIGFVLTAKSIFRFEGLKERKLAEYILIGTLYSFAFVIAVGYLTKYLIKVVVR